MFRFGEHLSQRDRSFVAVFGSFHSPFTQDSGGTSNHYLTVVQGRIIGQRTRKDSFVKCGRKNERSKGGSSRPFGLIGPVVFALPVVPPAYHRENTSGSIVDR